MSKILDSVNNNNYITSLFPINTSTEINTLKDLKVFNSTFTFEESSNKEEIKIFLNANYSYIKSKLDDKIKNISTKENLEKFCKEYALSAQVFQSKNPDIKRNFYGSSFEYRAQYYRRAIKYIIENICFFENKLDNNSSVTTNSQIFTEIIVLAEELLRVCGDLDLTNIFDSNLNLVNNSSNDCLDFYSLQSPCKEIISNFDSNFYNDPDLHFSYNVPKVFSQEINDLVASLFKNLYGTSLYLLTSYFEKLAKDNSFCCFNKDILFSNLYRHLKLSKKDAENFLKNLSIDLENYESQIYNPKRNNRLYKKIFFEFDKQIFFIPAMALESLGIIEQSLRFNTPPLPLNKESQKKLSMISNKVGISFENMTKDILERFNFEVFLNIKKYKKNKTSIDLGAHCGEIDVIAFNIEKKLCYFLECKMLNFSVESRHYLEDYNKFFSKNGYYSKFEKKIEYFNTHRNEIISSLLKESNLDFKFEYKFITFYPSISPFLLNDDKNNIKSSTLYDLKKNLNLN